MKQNVLPTEDIPFDLEKVEGNVRITKNVVIKPFNTVKISAQSKVRHHHKNVHVITEDRQENEQELPNLAVVPCYGILNSNSGIPGYIRLEGYRIRAYKVSQT